MKFFLRGLASVALSLIYLQNTQAADLDAGDYDYVPSGTNLALLYYQHATRDELYSGDTKVAGNNKLDSNVGIARYVRYMDLGSIQIAPQVLIPFGSAEAKGDISVLGESSGIGDIILANAFFLHTDNATKTRLGLTTYFYLPTGEYDKNQVVNLGENRYKFTLQGAYSTEIAPKLRWDAASDITFYGKNDEYIGDTKLEQDMGYQLQTNLRYNLKDNLDLRAGLSYADLGDTEVNNIKADGITQSKFWVGTSYSPTPTTSLIAIYGQDFKVENGFKEDNRFSFRLTKVF